MSDKATTVEVTLESKLESVEAAEEIAQRVCRDAGFSEEDRHKIGMAVHESMINAIFHGNKSDPHKRVRMRLEVFPDRLEIRIRDQGLGFDLGSLPDPLEAENLLRVSGRGIFLIRTFMDEFRVENVKGTGTEVTLVKRTHSDSKLT